MYTPRIDAGRFSNANGADEQHEDVDRFGKSVVDTNRADANSADELFADVNSTDEQRADEAARFTTRSDNRKVFPAFGRNVSMNNQLLVNGQYNVNNNQDGGHGTFEVQLGDLVSEKQDGGIDIQDGRFDDTTLKTSFFAASLFPKQEKSLMTALSLATAEHSTPGVDAFETSDVWPAVAALLLAQMLPYVASKRMAVCVF
ncbi:uncharacterized protein LOC108679661 [Hyalella azteca]|uniref:Uncharacterized protein LOC108679661 n=1 Tax=Hyalella azteca TaxID=294128 RepID=A0A8B7PDZ0_HYAAZ|nr:uncharacterized protein LOC108679661 [Hyalella azteca]